MRIANELIEGLRLAWSTVCGHKLRSVLALLGIVIGIISVTLMGAALDSVSKEMERSFSAFGADVLFVQRFAWMVESEDEWMQMQNRRPITLKHAELVAKQMTHAQAVAPVVQSSMSIQYKTRRTDTAGIIGTTDQGVQTSNFNMAQGRFFSKFESERGRPVCVLGGTVASALFENESPLGKKIEINGAFFEVVGVLEKTGGFMEEFNADNQVAIPISQFTSKFWAEPDVQIHVKVKDMAQVDDARAELRGILRKIRRIPAAQPDDFSLEHQGMFLEMFRKEAAMMAAAGFSLTGLSLFVGGIGIMNIMFVSVAERTREIGIRKATGARRRNILIQFLTEASGICLIGGLVAVGLAWPIVLIVGRFVPATLSWPVIGAALLVSLVTGVVSGFLPAWRAARMNPVDALRAE